MMAPGDVHTILPPVNDRMHQSVEVSHPERPASPWSVGTQLSRFETPTFSVCTSFLVSPRQADSWIQAWQDLAAIAEAFPDCRHFRLTQDQNDELCFEFRSEWVDAEAYISFEQNKRVRVIERELAARVFIKETRVCKVIPVTAAHIHAPKYDA